MLFFSSLVCPFGDMAICKDYIAEWGLVACTWGTTLPDQNETSFDEVNLHKGNYDSCCQTCGQLRDPNIPGKVFFKECACLSYAIFVESKAKMFRGCVKSSVCFFI